MDQWISSSVTLVTATVHPYRSVTSQQVNFVSNTLLHAVSVIILLNCERRKVRDFHQSILLITYTLEIEKLSCFSFYLGKVHVCKSMGCDQIMCELSH